MRLAPLTKFDVGDVGLPNAEPFGDAALRPSRIKEAAHFIYLGIGQSGFKLPAVKVRAVPDFVGAVLGWGCPTEVIGRYVGWVPVPMGNLVLWGWLGTVKGKAHQLVNQFGTLGMSTHRKADGWVSSGLVHPRSKDARNLSLIGTYTAMATDLIIGVLRNGAPRFIHPPVLTRAGS